MWEPAAGGEKFDLVSGSIYRIYYRNPYQNPKGTEKWSTFFSKRPRKFLNRSWKKFRTCISIRNCMLFPMALFSERSEHSIPSNSTRLLFFPGFEMEPQDIEYHLRKCYELQRWSACWFKTGFGTQTYSEHQGTLLPQRNCTMSSSYHVYCSVTCRIAFKP